MGFFQATRGRRFQKAQMRGTSLRIERKRTKGTLQFAFEGENDNSARKAELHGAKRRPKGRAQYARDEADGLLEAPARRRGRNRRTRPSDPGSWRSRSSPSKRYRAGC